MPRRMWRKFRIGNKSYRVDGLTGLRQVRTKGKWMKVRKPRI